MFSEANLHKYGTPLPLLELDQVPSKKPVFVQDQIATDEQGRRRFHGAFTGGFSAGYWNTVGSKEGWTPQSFKSSRTEKTTDKISQKPEDFMDEEDRGEFGIAPKGLQIDDDFTSNMEQSEKRKRKFLQNDLQPIPGEPVLQQLIKPIKDKAAVRILKTWGWRPGQGIGPRQTKKEKKKARERNKKELYLMEKYGCEMPQTEKFIADDEQEDDDDEDSEDTDDEITFAPEDCDLPPYKPKLDTFGLGYEPLSRESVLGKTSLPTEHLNFFKPLETLSKNNQKISFTGQAFGVGALEEDDDEDVYAADDFTRYDFSLEDKKTKKIKQKSQNLEGLIFDEFILDHNPPKLPVYNVEVPFGWHPRNWNERRSRFEPLDPKKQRQLEEPRQQHEMSREKRAALLGEQLIKGQSSETNEKLTEIKTKTVEDLQKEHKERQEKTKLLMEKISATSTRFTKGGLITLEGEEKPYTNEDISSAFKPFASDEKKQTRYEQFLAREFKNEQEINDFLKTIQPLELSLWDRQMELKEFQQAKKLYRPLRGIMSDRFVTESEIKAEEMVTKKTDMKQIVVERTKVMWKPHSLLCKRYNIAEPFKGLMEEDSKSKGKQKKLSVFDYLETSVNKKEDFQTPVIIPKNIEKPQAMVKTAVNTSNDEKTVTENTPLEWQQVLNPKEKAPVDKKIFTFKPKTDLEKKVVESLNKPVAEKKELFKSIFSDSETEEDEDEKEENNKKETIDIIQATSRPLNAAAANLLRNDSPPRGIFKALFNTNTTTKQIEETLNQKEITEKTSNEETVTATTTENNKILFQPKSSRETKESLSEEEISTEIYGPALPKSFSVNKKVATNTEKSSAVDKKLLELFNKHKPKLEVTEKWVEKGSNNESSDSDSSSQTDDSQDSTFNDECSKHKKKVKKTKKKKSSTDRKHKKHKDHKTGKKHKKRDKKNKKHNKK